MAFDSLNPVNYYGICWSKSPNPTILDFKTIDSIGKRDFVGQMTELLSNTLYYVRAYVTDNIGTVYGNELSFKLLINTPDVQVKDIDGNTYHSVNIGTQIWMVENLKTTRYNDGSAIPNVTNGSTWAGLKTGAYCWYGNDSSIYRKDYGALYNWYAVIDNNSLCPTGWHVPNWDEWTILAFFLEVAPGSKMKEIGTLHWTCARGVDNKDANNDSGFTGRPGGRRIGYSGSFSGIGLTGFWLSATEDLRSDGVNTLILNCFPGIYTSSFDKESGFSIRCIKDSK